MILTFLLQKIKDKTPVIDAFKYFMYTEWSIDRKLKGPLYLPVCDACPSPVLREFGCVESALSYAYT